MSAETGLFLDGLRCAGCVNKVERALRAVPGVEAASVNYTNHRALVRFDPGRVDSESLVDCVGELGYAAQAYDPGALDRPAEIQARAALVRVLVAAFLAANVMMVAVALYIGSIEGIDATTRRSLRWVAIALSVPAVTWCALPFWKGAWSGLRRGSITIDVPIALGIGTAFAVNVAGTLAESHHLYVDSATMIVFLILLGRTLERGARARASAAVDRLTAMTPKRALRRRAGALEEVSPSELVVGDLVVIPAGESVPADARILRGESELDESLLTGEAEPVLRGPGAAVVGGTCNTLAELEVEVTAPVDAGTLARLAALLERAQAERPRVERLANRVASVFAPSVLAIAAATALAWAWSGADAMQVALTAAAVLIVACPCALGLATPAAVTAAVGRAAKLGILVKSGEALERCAAVSIVVLDKTGTLSEGRFAVEALVPAPGWDEASLLALAAGVEGRSTHPVAEAICDAAERRGFDAAERTPRTTLAGQGVVAGEGKEIARVGSLALLEEAGIVVGAGLREAASKLGERGMSLAWVAEGPGVAGVIGLWDPLREDAGAAVSRLRRDGLEVALVSGDHRRAVELAGSASGIRDLSWAVSPDAKLDQVRARRAGGAGVLMAGDGINDAAALAAADVGVALSRGADVALHAADVVVRSSQLSALADLVELARATLARIRENLLFAILYNLVAIPLAASGWLHPLYAALAMSLSSLVVTGNSVRLLSWRSRP